MADVLDTTAEPSMEEILASIRKIIADEKPVVEPVAERPEPVEDDNILELTSEPEEVPVVPQPVEIPPPPPPAPAPPPEPTPTKLPEKADALVSDRVGSAVSSSLEALAQTVQIERMAAMSSSGVTSIGNGHRTLEDMTMELMRPMLKEWLDDNLKALVEHLVQKEVERITRRV